MIKQLAIKELRESLGLAALCVLAMVWMVSGLTGVNVLGLITSFGHRRYGEIAFVNDSFVGMSALFVGALAAALGLKQSAWEHGKGTYYFLLHRPIRRWQVVATKSVVGLLITLAILAAAICWYAWWAATPGNQPMSFSWSMTADAWKLALVLPLIYLGAFLSGMRPGRWLGTRLAPLAGTILWAILAFAIAWWWLYLPLLLIGCLCAITAISYHTESRDY